MIYGVLIWLIIIIACIKHRKSLIKNFIADTEGKIFLLAILVTIAVLLIKAISSDDDKGWYVFLFSPLLAWPVFFATLLFSMGLGELIKALKILPSKIDAIDIAMYACIPIVLAIFCFVSTESLYEFMSNIGNSGITRE